MKSIILVFLFALTKLCTCSTIPLDQAINQSPPFALVVLSQDQNYNGTTLIPCEKGKQGPFPGLCPLAYLTHPISSLERFNLNYTSSSPTNAGYLTYQLQNRETSTGLSNVSAPMAFNNADSYKVPIFGYADLSGATQVSFNSQNMLGVPEVASSSDLEMAGSASYDKWYICDLQGGDLAATYPSVVWNMGGAAPQLGSCLKVDVVRVFA